MVSAGDRASAASGRENIGHLYAVLESYLKDLQRVDVKQGSRFWADHERLPDHNIGPWVSVLLDSAIDHVRTVEWMSSNNSSDDWHLHSTWTNLRASLEISSQIVWIVSAKDREVRLARFLRLVNDDMQQYFEANRQRLRPRDKNRLFEKYPELAKWKTSFEALVAKWPGSESNRIMSKVNIIECIQDSPKVTFTMKPDDAALLWRVAGAFAHGRPWASMMMGPEWTESPSDGGKVEVPDKHMGAAAQMLLLVVNTVMVAGWMIVLSCGHDREAPNVQMFPE